MRFRCPTCRSKLSAPAAKAGAKTHCPGCGQRIQVPAPVNRTVLGLPEPERAAAPGARRGRLSRWQVAGIAAVSLGLARRTTDRYWAYARARLYEMLSDGSGPGRTDS